MRGVVSPLSSKLRAVRRGDGVREGGNEDEEAMCGVLC
jgi:hypothetical protein